MKTELFNPTVVDAQNMAAVAVAEELLRPVIRAHGMLITMRLLERQVINHALLTANESRTNAGRALAMERTTVVEKHRRLIKNWDVQVSHAVEAS